MESPSLDRIMTDLSVYRDADMMHALTERIRSAVKRPHSIMEVCGGQTFTLSRYRIEELLPEELTMVHGPGCPVCVTPQATVDQAIELAMTPGVILCSFGDMIRVPGTKGSLLRAKAAGADVRILYSPLEALDIARENPGREVVFFAIGFETTTPIYALMVKKAREARIGNLTLLTSLFLVPPAVRALKQDPDCRIDALLAAGHVCAITGTEDYEALARELRIPIVITGFEPVDMLLGLLRAVEMLERGEHGVANAYGRVVSPEGNPEGRRIISEIFEPYDAEWRGIGKISHSGMKLREEAKQFNSRNRFHVEASSPCECSDCIASMIMKGLKRPTDCRHFATSCTPDSPVGAPMVSGEGVCAAYYRYNR